MGKLPLDLGHRCPNRRYGGCIFCAAPAFSPGYLQAKGDISSQLDRGKKQFLHKRFRKYFAYFQQETATAQPISHLLPVLEMVLGDPDCVGVILSTRPDYISEELPVKLAEMAEFSGKDCLIELGLQSVHKASLALLNRNHSYSDFLQACKKIRRFETLEIGVHLLFGIPGETRADMLASVKEVVDLGVDALKFHQLQILKETPLEEFYAQGRVIPMLMDEYLDLLLEILPMVPENVVVHRLWATAHPDMLIAPRWQVLAAELNEQLRKRMEEREIHQGCSVAS